MTVRLGRLVTGSPRLVLVAAAVIAILGALAGGAAISRLSAGNHDYLDPGSPDAVTGAQMLRATGVDPEEGFVALIRLPARLARAHLPRLCWSGPSGYCADCLGFALSATTARPLTRG